MVERGGKDVFLFLPRVLLEARASILGLRAEGLGLLAIERLLERVRAEEGGEPSKTMLPMGGRPLS